MNGKRYELIIQQMRFWKILKRQAFKPFIFLVILSIFVAGLGHFCWERLGLKSFEVKLDSQFQERGSALANSPISSKTIPLGTSNVAIGGGGYVTGIYLHPKQRDLVYIRTDIGGFYRWNANQQRWIPISDTFGLSESNYYGGESLALDPNNPDIVYIAVGKYLTKPGAIFKSTNRGETWTKLKLELPMGGNQNKRWVGRRLVVSPTHSNVILLGSRQDGLWRSQNAGTTWTKITTFPGQPKEDIGILSLSFDPKIPGLVYANAYDDGIYQSSDFGTTWSKLKDSPKTVNQILVAGDGTLYATSSTTPGVSQYASGTWRDITPKNQKEPFNGLTVNPTNPQHLLVSIGERAYSIIYQSRDGGKTWTEHKRSLTNNVPWWNGIMLKQPWVSAIAFDPQVPNRVWLTDWYGIWRTPNINTNPIHWTNYQQGHEEIVTFSLVSPPTGAPLLSGVADVDGFYHDRGLNQFPSQRLGVTNSKQPWQDTYSIAYCQTNPLKMVRVGGQRWNNSYQVATSADGGKTWRELTSFPSKMMPLRVAISAADPNLFVVTVSGNQPLRTPNGGITWEKVKGLPDATQGPWNWSQSLAADSQDGKTFYYYGHDKFYRSTDGGATFQVVYQPLNGKSYWHSVKVDPRVKGEVWVSLDQNGLYRSSDAGKSFNKLKQVETAYLFALGKPQPGSSISALYLYGKIAGMGEGIFQSLDRGKTWVRLNDSRYPIGNEPNVMEASQQEFGLVFVGTNGRGIYYGYSPKP